MPYLYAGDFIYFLIADVPSENAEGIFIYSESTDGNSVSDLDGIQIRYVMIPGGVPAKMKDNFLKDYQQVKTYYGIPD